MTTDNHIEEAGLRYGAPLHKFLVEEALPGSGVERATFFEGFSSLVTQFGQRNAELLSERARLQVAIDEWHRSNDSTPHNATAYREYLEEVGYIVDCGEPFSITTVNVDPEISTIPGPQLVVPVMNARYAINAANARWGSLYDALYGTDALGDLPGSGSYDPDRGERVIAWVRSYLDDVVPLASGTFTEITSASVTDGELIFAIGPDKVTGLADPSQFVAFDGPAGQPTAIVLRCNGLAIEIQFDAEHPVGRTDKAGISDVELESAITAIVDCEDSVAAVDAQDKALAYRNWLGLMKGTLTAEVHKAGSTFTRVLADDRRRTRPDGTPVDFAGRALMLVRNVGHLMTTPAVRTADGQEVPEGLVDAMVTTLAATHDLRGATPGRNSAAGSVYVVKPKMHGPAEVAFAGDVFGEVERILDLPANTVKLGIMDEERRTTVNLAECIRAAADRVAFINTGFLDRTGDEIHTSMEAGPFVPKSEMKAQRWIGAYEDWNVDVGLACGLRGVAQIGKGMWAAPSKMRAMLDEKIDHPRSGANCAWVPSPTAATLHATHYHRVDVLARQSELGGSPRATLDDILTIPVATDPAWSADEVQAELENNAQGILGYVVRWINAGVGCSTVPDINDVGLMEDRATCRISSQHIANWLRHGVIDEDMVRSTLERMAAKVDSQNSEDPLYEPMSPRFDGAAFRAACALIFSGTEQPSGYTEPILHAYRLEKKLGHERSR